MTSAKRPAGIAPAVGDRLQTTIEKMVIGGAALARPNGFVLFVQDGAPGDVLEVEVTKLHNNHGEAKILKILTPSPDRREPPCVYARECGGCNWQHLLPTSQLRQKESLLKETLEKFLPGVTIPLLDFVASPRDLRYRNRVQPLRQDGKLGYRKRRSHDFLPVTDCLIAEEPLAEFFKNVPPGPNDTRIELRLDTHGQARALEPDDEDGFAFSQVNRFQNEQLIETAMRWADEHSPTAVWDLYCGSGNFTFPLAKAFPSAQVTGVEMSSTLVKLAREETLRRKDRNLEFFIGDVTAWIRRRTPAKGSLIVVDPPRAGLGQEGMRALATTDATAMIYVACHPVALARDLAAALEDSSRGWKLKAVQGFEMFPQTDHFEVLAHLVREG